MLSDMYEPASSVQVLSSNTKSPVGTVCICTRDHISAGTFMSALHNDWRFLKERGGGVSWLVIQGSILTLQRNEALRQMDGDWLLFIDDDMTWAPDAIGKLIESWEEVQEQFEEPVILGALCSRRQDPHDPTMYMRDSRYEGKYRMIEKWEDDIVEVDATGLAFLLIPKQAIKNITGDTFADDKETRMLYQAPPVFKWTHLMGEDLRFCQEALAAGCRIFVDTRIQIGHLAEHVVTYTNFLEGLANRSQDDYEMVKAINDKHGLPTMTPEEARERLGWKMDTRPGPSDGTSSK